MRQAQSVGLLVLAVMTAVVFVAGAEAAGRPDDRAGMHGVGTNNQRLAMPDVIERAAARAVSTQTIRPNDRAGTFGVGVSEAVTPRVTPDVFERATARAHQSRALRPDDRGGVLGIRVSESDTGVVAGSAISSASSGFGWGQAMFGAAAAFGLILVGGAIGRRSKTITY
jgi:hypothetical protein